ncbi:MAG: VIT1/CCC1 transporter family protein [Bacteroidota bacterium]|nr:VIT1/CCC1 transporter family protein [Bacteroidota bacterium]MDP4234422.1 VIT1/CCC1 transporter family protein [Bacteroidota bacterium]MDP4243988.1 VIT1/CCC1 transporter family protein [Bacteroidota bacterium]MDP4288154.1 VIT1/CCC1 transporter family protein [Bacteroidota bacterium]
MSKAHTIKVLRENYRAEREAAEQYRALAERERDEVRKTVLYKLVDQEEKHAARWKKRLEEMGEKADEPSKISMRYKRMMVRSLDTDTVLRRMEADEVAAERAYSRMIAGVTDTDLIREIEEVKKEEEVHSKVLRSMYGPSATIGDTHHPQGETRSKLEGLMRRERWHVKSGSWVADAIYGANDGLGAVFGIVSGVAGATDVAGGASTHFVLLSGFAGMIASSVSMGSSAYLAAKSEREVYEGEMHRERQEMEENPEEEKEELSLMYQLRGFSEEEANDLADKLSQQPEEFLKVMGAEELGLSEMSFPTPFRSLASGGFSTLIGAFIPLIPFFFFNGMTAVAASFALSLVAHFAVGAAKSIITVRSWWKSGLEMAVVGVIVAVVTYGIGRLFEISLN